MKDLEVKIGDTLPIICVESPDDTLCNECIFIDNYEFCSFLKCCKSERKDNKSVIFKLIDNETK